jgi:hypothetical protein
MFGKNKNPHLPNLGNLLDKTDIKNKSRTK